MSLSSNSKAKPLPAPPSIVGALPQILIPTAAVSSVKPPLVTPSPEPSDEVSPLAKSLKICGTKEKVGRWSDHEHMVFLEGLKTYGKQWKTIAGMIGTRSVVQVRTHAQKYFQKMERKNQGVNMPKTKSKPERQSKRKSLPSSMPARKKSKKPAALALGNRVASAPVLAPSVTQDAVVHELTSFPSYVSNSSFSTSSDNWSAVSPTCVTDTIDLHNPIDKAAVAIEVPGAEQFEIIGDDPLEWLIETDTHQFLPESSLPLFPDLSQDKVVCEHMVLEAKNTSAQEQSANSMVEDAISNMTDTSITMKSLFLPAESSAAH